MHIMRVKSSDYPLVRFLALIKVKAALVVSAALIAILLADATGHSYAHQTSPNGKISLKAVSWELVKRLAEQDAGLSGHEVAILNPVNRSVIASGTTDSSGLVEFEIPPGTTRCSVQVTRSGRYKSSRHSPRSDSSPGRPRFSGGC
jgi:hypothetical protein